MQAIEFQTTIHNGVIQLPEVYTTWGEKPVKVILLADEEPAAQTKRKRKPGSAKGKVKIMDDFDAPLEDFKEYMP